MARHRTCFELEQGYVEFGEQCLFVAEWFDIFMEIFNKDIISHIDIEYFMYLSDLNNKIIKI